MVVWSGSLARRGETFQLSSYRAKPGHGSCLNDAVPERMKGDKLPTTTRAAPVTTAQKARAITLLKNKYSFRAVAGMVGITMNQVRHLQERYVLGYKNAKRDHRVSKAQIRATR